MAKRKRVMDVDPGEFKSAPAHATRVRKAPELTAIENVRAEKAALREMKMRLFFTRRPKAERFMGPHRIRKRV